MIRCAPHFSLLGLVGCKTFVQSIAFPLKNDGWLVANLIWKDPPHQSYDGLKVKGDELIGKTSPQ